MRIILDTDTKEIIVPWNYQQKLEEINRIIRDYGGEGAEEKTFTGFIDDCWRFAMAHCETQVKTALKPQKSGR